MIGRCGDQTKFLCGRLRSCGGSCEEGLFEWFLLRRPVLARVLVRVMDLAREGLAVALGDREGTKRVEEGYTEGTGYGKVQRKYSGDQVKE